MLAPRRGREVFTPGRPTSVFTLTNHKDKNRKLMQLVGENACF